MKRTIYLSVLATLSLTLLTTAAPCESGSDSNGLAATQLATRHTIRMAAFATALGVSPGSTGTATTRFGSILSASTDTNIVVPEAQLAGTVISTLYPHNGYPNTRNIYSMATKNAGSYPNPAEQFRLAMLRFPISGHVPAGRHVVSARLILTTVGSSATIVAGAYRDTVFAVLDTLPGHVWHTSELGGRAESPLYVARRATSWLLRRQFQIGAGMASDSGYPGDGVDGSLAHAGYDTAEYSWSPPWSAVVRSIDVGPRSYGFVPAATWTAYASSADSGAGARVSLDVTRAVQYAVNGARNNGFLIWYQDNGGSAATIFQFHDFAASAANYHLTPALEIIWDDTPYTSPWGNGKEVAFAFTSDDGINDANDAWSAIFSARNLSYTINVARTQINRDAPYGGTFLDLVNWWDRGMEIGNHGYHHWDMRSYPFGPTDAGYAALVPEFSRAWIDSGMAANDGDDSRRASFYASQQMIGHVFATPLTYWDLNCIAVADSLGYLGVRLCDTYTGDMTVGTAIGSMSSPGDTLGADGRGAKTTNLRNYGIRVTNPFNIMTVPRWDYPINIEAAVSSDSAAVKRIVRLCIEDRIVRGQNALWTMLSHDIDADIYAFGNISAQHMRWILNAMQESGVVRIDALGPLLSFMRSQRTFIAHPAHGGDLWISRFNGLRHRADGSAAMVWVNGMSGCLTPVHVGATRAPGRLFLAQNSPNPFNPRTTIRFDISQPGLAQILVYDLRGRLVRKLVKSEMAAGTHNVDWDGRDDRGYNLPSGVYMVRMTTAQGSRVTKATLTR